MADPSDEQTQQRLEKLSHLRQRGIDPYPNRATRSHSAAEAIAAFEGYEGAAAEENAPQVDVCGRIVASRGMGRATFFDIRDGTGRLQLYLRQDVLGPESYAALRDFDLGDFVSASGRMFRTRSGEISLEVHRLTMLAKALRPLPEKWHGLTDVEKRYRQRYLDMISNEETSHLFQVRGRILSAVRRSLEERGFLEVETPILTPRAGGALARPFETHHNALNQNLYLRIATELHLKRLIVGGLERVFEVGRVFRNEGISTKHNPEYTLLECYQAYADYNDMMALVEQVVSQVTQEVVGSTKVAYQGHELDFSPPWRRLTLRQAILENCGVDFTMYPDAEGLRTKCLELGLDTSGAEGRGKLIDLLQKSFVEPKLVQPTFLVDYPVETSPLAKKKPDDPELVERFEPFAGGMEFGNAYSELNDPLEQRARFEEQAALRAQGDEETEPLDEDFLLALEHGMPPTGGLGIGIDRLVMLLTDQSSIREVILFPQLRTKD